MNSYTRLLLNNKAWSEDTRSKDPDFFSRLEKLQTPEFLWIGCSDSRVPANEITGTQPGEIFVHRNIANLVVHTDLNLLSVLQYAVDVLKVKHIIVCGHYGCGGVQAAMGNQSMGIINSWLRPIKNVHKANQQEVDSLPTAKERLDRMVELSVTEQLLELSKTNIIQKAWTDRRGPKLHGWVYSLSDGIIKDLCQLDADSAIDPIYRFDDL